MRWLVTALAARRVQARGITPTDDGSTSPLRFRALGPADVEGALGRLRGLGRVAV